MTTEIKYFTPAEARKTLPLVKNIVRDILLATREMRLIAEEINGGLEDDIRKKNWLMMLMVFFLNLKKWAVTIKIPSSKLDWWIFLQ